MEFADRIERLRCIRDGMGDLYNNDEILAVDVGYGIPGGLTVEQMAQEAEELLDELLEGSTVPA